MKQLTICAVLIAVVFSLCPQDTEAPKKEVRKIPPGMQDNVMKPILFWSALGIGVAGIACNTLGFIDMLNTDRTRAAYTAITNTASAEFDAAWKTHSDAVYYANLKYIAGYACYTITAGLLTWWLFTPEFIPEVKVAFLPGPSGEFTFAFEYRF
ncbi:MAG: hypothetical protein AABZ39_13630 [Spirochaetota bacterium]